MKQVATPALPRRCQVYDELRRRQCLRRAVKRVILPNGRITYTCAICAQCVDDAQAALIT